MRAAGRQDAPGVGVVVPRRGFDFFFGVWWVFRFGEKSLRKLVYLPMRRWFCIIKFLVEMLNINYLFFI